MAYKLSDRPSWWVPKALKWLAVLCVFFAVLFFITSVVTTALEVFDILALSGDEGASMIFNFRYFAIEAAFVALRGMAYAFVFWVFSLAVDKLDQLVWLNASNEDREEIIARRRKKNAKNK